MPSSGPSEALSTSWASDCSKPSDTPPPASITGIMAGSSGSSDCAPSTVRKESSSSSRISSPSSSSRSSASSSGSGGIRVSAPRPRSPRAGVGSSMPVGALLRSVHGRPVERGPPGRAGAPGRRCSPASRAAGSRPCRAPSHTSAPPPPRAAGGPARMLGCGRRRPGRAAGGPPQQAGRPPPDAAGLDRALALAARSADAWSAAAQAGLRPGSVRRPHRRPDHGAQIRHPRRCSPLRPALRLLRPAHRRRRAGEHRVAGRRGDRAGATRSTRATASAPIAATLGVDVNRLGFDELPTCRAASSRSC